MLRSRANANRYRNLLILSVTLFLACEVALAYTWRFGFSFTVHLAAFLLVPVFVSCFFMFWIRYRTWSAGAEGEEKVVEVLSSLKGFHVLNDIVLPGGKANIDHVVLSNKGVFVVETKNHKGIVRCRGDSWELVKTGRKGTLYAGDIGNPSKQVKKNALTLRNFSRRNLELILM